MAADQQKELIRRYYLDLWNLWNFALLPELLTDDIMFRGSLGVVTRGIESFRGYMETIRAAFPDFRNVIEELVGEEDVVGARLTYSGAHQGALFGIQPTGVRISYEGLAIFHLNEGKIADGWVLGNTLSLLRQLGASGGWEDQSPAGSPSHTVR
jgi:steroid delta-isomerase-like uncharacterized protein